MKLLPYGEHAVLVEVADSAHALALAARLAQVPGVDEAVPGARTVLVSSRGGDLDGLRNAVHAAVAGPGPVPLRAGHVELPVSYDGADLAAVAAELGIAAAEVVRRHSAGSYTVAFCGFAPGFAYLTGLDQRLQVGRLAEPRTAVPAGSVGVAGEFTGVYPRPSPGGWRLLGTTDTELWDATRAEPALLTPGTTVRFTPT